ncbi:unnamed protein product [Protopolystoma xenopodis]|uniref:Uncharacterized protein n=1 Tax=Protopolystoma xenopodis TaxID=117903 RepID=A0A3S5B3D8_9PLAT|nr:unnamed protein product [Protopolystoma xenopodis]
MGRFVSFILRGFWFYNHKALPGVNVKRSGSMHCDPHLAYREQTAYRKAQKRPSSTSVLEPPTSHAVVPSRLISQQNYENALVQKALNTTTSGLDDADNTVLLGPAQIDHSDYRPNSVARTNLNRSIIVDQSFEGGEESDIEVDGEIDTGLDDGGVEDEDEEVQGNTNQINKTDYLTVTKSQELSSGEFGDKPVFTDNILPARANLLSETSENAMKETNVVDDEAFDYEVPTLPVIFPVKQARVSLVTAIPSSSTPSGTVESVV